MTRRRTCFVLCLLSLLSAETLAAQVGNPLTFLESGSPDGYSLVRRR